MTWGLWLVSPWRSWSSSQSLQLSSRKKDQPLPEAGPLDTYPMPEKLTKIARMVTHLTEEDDVGENETIAQEILHYRKRVATPIQIRMNEFYG